MLAMCLYHHARLSSGGLRNCHTSRPAMISPTTAEDFGDSGEPLERRCRLDEPECDQSRARREGNPGGRPVERRRPLTQIGTLAVQNSVAREGEVEAEQGEPT